MSSAGMIGHAAVLPAKLDPRFIWASLALVAALIAGAVIIALVDRWRKQPSLDGLSPGDQLSHFRNLYEQGAITKEEFEQIRTRLAGKLRDELKGKTPPPAGPASPAPPGPPERTPPLEAPRPPEPPNGVHPG